MAESFRKHMKVNPNQPITFQNQHHKFASTRKACKSAAKTSEMDLTAFSLKTQHTTIEQTISWKQIAEIDSRNDPSKKTFFKRN